MGRQSRPSAPPTPRGERWALPRTTGGYLGNGWVRPTAGHAGRCSAARRSRHAPRAVSWHFQEGEGGGGRGFGRAALKGPGPPGGPLTGRGAVAGPARPPPPAFGVGAARALQSLGPVTQPRFREVALSRRPIRSERSPRAPMGGRGRRGRGNSADPDDLAAPRDDWTTSLKGPRPPRLPPGGDGGAEGWGGPVRQAGPTRWPAGSHGAPGPAGCCGPSR